MVYYFQDLTQPIVIAETCFVLESFYKHDRAVIASKIEIFLSQKWLKVENRRTMLNLWEYYIKGFHFVDSFLLAWRKIKKGEILTFDKEMCKESTLGVD